MTGMTHIPAATTPRRGRSIAAALMAVRGVTISEAVAAARREPMRFAPLAAMPQKPTFSYRTAASAFAA